MEKNEKLIENAIEIAMNTLPELQDIMDMGRNRVISEYIIKWAEEAETEYQRLVQENGGEYPYYDFIDEFSLRKLNETKERCWDRLIHNGCDTNPAEWVNKLLSMWGDRMA